MALPITTDSLDSIPEAVRDQYVQDGDKFRLSLDGYEDPAGLKSALEKERKAAREASKSASQWASLGKSPEEIQELLAAQAKAEEEKLNKAGEWDKLKAQINEQHLKDKATLEAKLASKDKAIEKYLIDAQGTEAIAAAGGRSVKALMYEVRAQTKVIEEDGELNVRVVNARGEPRVNGKGDYLTIKDLVAELKEDPEWGGCFGASGGNGGGAQPAGNGKTAKTFKDLSEGERVELYKRNPDEYRRLREQSGKH